MNLLSRLCALSLVAAIAALAAPAVHAQDVTVGWNPRTGDVWVDTWLDDINTYGSRYRQPFVDEMVRYHDAPRAMVLDLLGSGWAPGDVYYACAIADIIGRPCRYVADQWARDRSQGWGALAKQLGIKPGSPEFHRLKRGFVSSYDRWGRPIRIDEALFDDYPERARLIRDGRDRDGYRMRFDDNRGGREDRSDRGHRNDDRGNSNANRGNNRNDKRGNNGNGNRGNGNGKGNRGNNGNGKNGDGRGD